MNRKVLIKPAANQGNIQLFFTKSVSTPPKQEAKEVGLYSENKEVQEFYNSLTKAEVLAHTIAIEKLGTSYDITRTHGFTKWQAMRKGKP